MRGCTIKIGNCDREPSDDAENLFQEENLFRYKERLTQYNLPERPTSRSVSLKREGVRCPRTKRTIREEPYCRCELAGRCYLCTMCWGFFLSPWPFWWLFTESFLGPGSTIGNFSSIRCLLDCHIPQNWPTWTLAPVHLWGLYICGGFHTTSHGPTLVYYLAVP